jgi:hypothetical protein
MLGRRYRSLSGPSRLIFREVAGENRNALGQGLSNTRLRPSLARRRRQKLRVRSWCAFLDDERGL